MHLPYEENISEGFICRNLYRNSVYYNARKKQDDLDAVVHMPQIIYLICSCLDGEPLLAQLLVQANIRI